MRKQDRILIMTIIIAMFAVITALSWQIYHAHATTQQQTTTVQKKKTASEKSKKKMAASKKSSAKKSSKQSKSNSSKKTDPDLWKKPTGGTYPTLTVGEPLKLTVSLSKQRVYLDNQSTGKRLYMMICSSGMDNTTPTGTYAIQERGESFFNAQLNEGANYWVSWLYHGTYLFHTVPTDTSGNYNVAEAQKLGKPASHGCIRLSVPDAKWLYDNVPEGTTVVVEK